MKHVKVVKAVCIDGKNYTCPKAAAKRWVEMAGAEIYNRQRAPFGNWRANRAWAWYRDRCMIGSGKRQRYWRRVVPIMENLLR